MEAEAEFLILPVDICRICNMLSPNLNKLCETLADEHVLIHEALEFVCCLKVDFGDGMSETMCPTCCNKLLHAYRFKNQALESYRTFYYQNTDFNVKKKLSIIDECDSTITIIEEKNFIDYKPQNEPTLILERVKDLEIDLTTDAISFLQEQHRTNEALSIEQSQMEKEQRSLTETNNHTLIEQNQIKKPKQSAIKTNHYRQRRPNKVKCDVCHKMLPKKSNLIDHLRLHLNEKKFVCNFCQKSFVQVANYRAHLRIHTKERPFQCHMCSKTYSQANQLKTHIRWHTMEKNYKCEKCSKKFLTSSDLDKHKRKHDPNLQFPCDICGHRFVQKINLKVHLANVHREDKLLKPLICI